MKLNNSYIIINNIDIIQ